MATTEDPESDQPSKQAVISHLVHRLLEREGGNIPVEGVSLRVSDYADIGG